MITALPEGLGGAVETVRIQFAERHLNISSAVIEECVIGVLNAALDAGVAREEIIKQSQFYDAKHEIRISLK